MDRRRFLGTITTGSLGMAMADAAYAAASSPYAGVSAQTYVWTQVLGKEGKDLKDHLDLAFKEISACGYDGVETFAQYVLTPEDATRLKDLLRKHGLSLTGLYRGGAFHIEEKAQKILDEMDALAETAIELGCKHLIVNPDPIQEREKTDGELQCQAKYLDKAGALARECGASLDLHFHAPEMRNKERELRWNMDHTDPGLVHLCVDVHWMYRGGADPYALLEQYGSRVRGTHLRNSVHGIWSEDLSEGDIDYARIDRLLRAAGYRGWLTVELAREEKTPETRSLAESMKRSRSFVRQVFGT
jgi:inosose dehydratase